MPHRQVIEIYEFVNPLGHRCFEVGNMVQKFVDERREKTSIRMIPYVNLNIITQHLELENKRNLSLEEKNTLAINAYQASLGFHAASMQGKKCGREFLLYLQDLIINGERLMNIDTILESAEANHLDLEMFMDDFNSDWTKKAFEKDQKLASEMNITKAPTVVVYTSFNQDAAYLIDSEFSLELFHDICQKNGKIEKAQIIELFGN